MNRYMNIIPGEKTCCIMLYGYIGDEEEVNSKAIILELMEAERKGMQVDVRINSFGGSVYAGLGIFNALANSKANITLYIDGVAASMASAIAACGKPVKMSKYARLMIHHVSGGAYGSIKDLQQTVEEITKLEDSMVSIYAKKMNKTSDEVKAMFFDGEDHWFNAQEAKDLGLIDEIYDDVEAVAATEPQMIYNIINNRYDNQLKADKMDFKFLNGLAGFSAVANQDDLVAVLKAHEQARADREKEITSLQEQLKTYRDAEATRLTAENKALIDAALADGRINATTQAMYEALLTSDRDNAMKVIESLPVKKSVMQHLEAGNTEGAMKMWHERQTEIRNRNK